ncbi:MAG: hypothetical protein GWP91_11230, partial [Rhodobacterales bacterium]|nr:hypothetical protein [Rhodobacterales bacterium]
MCLSDRHVTFGATYRSGGRMSFAEPGVKPHYAPSRNVRIEHAFITLSFEPVAGSFSGSAVLKLHAMPAYPGHFSLNLDDVDLGTVKDESGNDLDHSYGDGKIVIRAQTAPTSVAVTWSAAKSSRGLYFTGPTEWLPERQHMCWTQCQDEDAHFVFPCHDHPGVKHPWTIELDAPAGYTLLSNGAQVSQSESDGRARARFEQAEPMPAYLFTAVAAKLSVVETSWRDRSVRYLV